MAYSYDFKDNVVYGADDINAIRASILSRGVIEESDESCKVILSENGITIQQGQAIFSDGCRIEVDSAGVEKQFLVGETNYVYFLNNTLAGVCEVIVSPTMPEGDYVLLAQIDADGTITDKRQFAQLKTADVQRYAASFSANFTLDESLEIGSVIATVELPKSNCSLIEFDMIVQSSSYMRVRILPKENNYVLWTFPDGIFDYGEIHDLYLLGKTIGIKYEFSGNQMILKLNSIEKKSHSPEIRSVKIAGVCIR